MLEEHSTAMMFRCFSGAGEGEPFMRFGILPQFKTRICLDLDLLDNRTIFYEPHAGHAEAGGARAAHAAGRGGTFELGMDENVP